MSKENNLYSNLANVCHLFYKLYFPHNKIAAKLDAILKKNHCKKIVFIGGLVYVAKLLQQKGYNITFVDYTPEMIVEAKKVLKGMRFVQGDMRTLQLAEKYDAVLAIGRSFTYMYSDADCLRTLVAFKNCLRNAGIVIIDNYETGKIEKGNYFNGSIKTQDGDVVIKRISKMRRVQKQPALYRWDCVYEKFDGDKKASFHDEDHLLRAFSKSETERLIKMSGLKFVLHGPNFEKRSFVTVARYNS